MFMTPGWPISSGAKLEHEIAERMQMIIHFYELIQTNPAEGVGGQVNPASPSNILIIWNKSRDSIDRIYEPRQIVPYYVEHEADRVGDFRLLRGAGGEAMGIIKYINRNLHNGKDMALAAAQRREANGKVLEDYYAVKS